MIRLHGIPISNYYNKVKFALLEKSLAFEEVGVMPFRADGWQAQSPLGKIPFIDTPHGPLAESQVIMDYLEAVAPVPPLVPADAYRAAKVREIIVFLETHAELTARKLYGEAFFGRAPASAEQRATIESELSRHLVAFKQLCRFSPYIAGDSFTMADCAAFAHLPLIALATRLTLGRDLVQEAGFDWKAYATFIEERPAAARISADRKAFQAQQKR